MPRSSSSSENRKNKWMNECKCGVPHKVCPVTKSSDPPALKPHAVQAVKAVKALKAK